MDANRLADCSEGDCLVTITAVQVSGIQMERIA
jgi:hypothetical protein